MADLEEEGGINAAARDIAARRERSQRVAVEAEPARHDVAALGPAGLEMVLARELEGGLDRLGAAGDEVGAREPGRRLGDEGRRQRFLRLAGEEAGMHVVELVELVLDRLAHLGMAVAEAGDGGPSRGVDVALARAVVEIKSLAPHGQGKLKAGAATQDVAHRGGLRANRLSLATAGGAYQRDGR